jgi:subtilisin-like proprotein convertase family protein
MSIISKIRLWWICLIFGVLGHFFASAQCSSPYGLDFNSITQQSVRVSWLDNNASKLGFDIDISPKGINSDGTPDYQIQGNTTSFTINALLPSTTYQIYLRTKCSNDNWSAWNGPFLFTTLLSNPTFCGTSLDLKDNGQEVFYIDITEDGKLGTDIFLESVDLIIDHGWPADLKISIISPGQKQVVLSEHHGTITDHFGDPKDETCQKYCQFSDDGCTFLETHPPPFIGTFKPDQPLYTFEDQSSPKGLWQLIIQDRAVFDNGILKYVKLRFSKQKCQTPEQIFLDGINATSAVINWQKKSSCQTVKIIIEECDKPQISRKEYFVNCNDQKFKIPALIPDRCYNVTLNAVCGSQLSLPSCQTSFSTRCKPITLEEHFNTETTCIEGCQFPCALSGAWQNASQNMQDWISWSGPTDSDQTGPSGDISGNGKYLYIENQPSICPSGKPVILESPCVLVKSAFDGCDMSFHTHMYGAGIQSIKLELSADGGLSWKEIFKEEGETGINWMRNILDLSDYDNKNAQLKFTAYTSSLVTGDIALDQIEFYGSTLQEILPKYFKDEDKDGYGNPQLFTETCSDTPPPGYVSNNLDCNDSNASVHPGASEIPCNLIDENCNGPEDDADPDNTLTIEYSVSPATCFGLQDGAIALNITGGMPPYIVEWNTGSDQLNIDSLDAGFYFASVTDASGCKAETGIINLHSVSNMQLSIVSVIKPTCLGKNDGQIIIDHAGGLSPFSYLWSDGSIGKNLVNAVAGTSGDRTLSKNSPADRYCKS